MHPLLTLLILTPLHYILTLLLFLASPITALTTYILSTITILLSIPLSLLPKLETLYIYLSTAALTGITTGIIFAVITSFIYSSLNLNTPPNAALRAASMKNAAASRKGVTTTNGGRKSLKKKGSTVAGNGSTGTSSVASTDADIDGDGDEEEGVFTSLPTAQQWLSVTGGAGGLVGGEGLLSPGSLPPGFGGKQMMFPILEEEVESELGEEDRGPSAIGVKRREKGKRKAL